MKKPILFILMLLAFSVAATAQVRRIAILETIDKENSVPYAVEVMVRSNLTSVISSTQGYEGYDRVNISAIMDEHDFERTGLVSEEQIRQLGVISGADYLLVSEAVKVDESNIFVTAKILNVETAKTEMSTNSLMGTSAQDIQHGCESLANRLLGLQDPYYQEKALSTKKDEKPVEETPVAVPEEKPVAPVVEKTVVMKNVRVGDVISFPDGSQGLVFYIGPEGKGLAVSLNQGEEPWDISRQPDDISMLKNYDDETMAMNYGEGERATKILCSSLGDEARAALWCRLQGEGWYLPSMGEFTMLTNAFKANPMMETVLKNCHGGELQGWYWTSSEHNRKEAWNVSDGGWLATEKKKEKNKVRAVRGFTEQ